MAQKIINITGRKNCSGTSHKFIQVLDNLLINNDIFKHKQANMNFLGTFIQLEKLEDVITQTKKLQQENESLSFVVESKSRFERCVQP